MFLSRKVCSLTKFQNKNHSEFQLLHQCRVIIERNIKLLLRSTFNIGHTHQILDFTTHIFEILDLQSKNRKNDDTMRLKNIVFTLSNSGKQLKFEL